MGTKVPGYPPITPSAPAVTVTWANLSGKPATFPPSAHTHLWSDVTDKPSVFAPAAHTHAYADITGKPATFTPSAHTHPWADLTDKPTTFPPSTHTHSYNDLTDKPSLAGRLVLLGTINVTETLLVSLALGMKRKTFALAGVTATDTLLAIPTGAPTTGCEVVNAYPASAGNVSIGYYTPLLGIGATYAIPISVFRIT